MDEIDFEADAMQEDALPDTPALKTLTHLVETMVMLQDSKKETEQRLADVDKKLRQVQEVDLPSALDACNVRSFTTRSGQKITVEPFFHASISGQKKPIVLNWLRATGNDGIIKQEVICAFGKGEESLAAGLKRLLAESGYQFDAEENVHAGTFKALVKELLGQGVAVPLEDLGVYNGRRAVIK